MVRQNRNVFLGRSVKDVGARGLNSLSEVQGIARKIVLKAKSMRTGEARRKANSRLNTLWLILQKSKRFTVDQKRKGFNIINKARHSLGFNPLRKFNVR